MKRTLLALALAAAAVILWGCPKTAYQRAVEAQRRETPAEVRREPLPGCPTPAAKGTADYERCQRTEPATETGIGGAGCEGVSVNDPQTLANCGVPPDKVRR